MVVVGVGRPRVLLDEAAAVAGWWEWEQQLLQLEQPLVVVVEEVAGQLLQEQEPLLLGLQLVWRHQDQAGS